VGCGACLAAAGAAGSFRTAESSGMSPLTRRAAIAVAGISFGAAAAPPAHRLEARQFGAKGDGVVDDTGALQAALDATYGHGGGVLTIPPGNYRITRTLRISAPGNISRQNGLIAHGAHLRSEVPPGANVIEVSSRSTHRFLILDGIEIEGSGREANGIVLECENPSNYLYNFCLRDVVVQNCGGDGVKLAGNVFEGQIINSYFRDNHANGATFTHGAKGGIISAIHVFGSVFGQNGAHGAAILGNAYDVAYHGCYFLLNAKFGLFAENGCTLLSNCGFENNHTAAPDFAHGDAAVSLNSFGTMIGCSGYSQQKQTALVKTYLTAPLTMIGCSGAGDGPAAKAGLAKLAGS